MFLNNFCYSKILRGKKSSKQLAQKEIRQTKARINIDIRKIIELEEDYCKQVRVGNFWNSNYIGYKRNGDKNRTLSTK